MPIGTAWPVSFDAFAGSMAAFGPFEHTPHLALGVSGGSDSLALCLLAAEWCRRQGGQLTALIVDHGLRDGSADEARRVADWLAQRRIASDILVWRGTKPASRLQARAREARYALMEDWCRHHGVLHLLVGHTADDQAETFFLRLQHGSGPDGLSGMSAVRELTHCRLLRPLLRMRRTALQGFLQAHGQDWIDDPTNDDTRFARTAVRQQLSAGVLEPEALWSAAHRYGQVRVVAEQAVDRFLATYGRMSSAGYGGLTHDALRTIPNDTAVRALARVITAVGGTWYPPKRQPLERLYEKLCGPGAASDTLGRCRVIADGRTVMIYREARNLPAPQALADNMNLRWDGRIAVRTADGARPDVHLVAGESSPRQTIKWSEAALGNPSHLRWQRLPQPARASLPVLADASGIFSAPLLTYNLKLPGSADNARNTNVSMTFRPRRALSHAVFFVA